MKILLTGAFNYTDKQLKELKENGNDIIYIKDEKEELDIDCTNIEAVVCNNLFLYNDISKFEKLKYIQLTSAGTDRIPIEYINRHGIKLNNARGVYSIPIAEWTVLKILEIYKKSRLFYLQQKDKIWNKDRNIIELNGKNVAIIGYGSIGEEIAKRLNSFGTNIIAVDITEKKSEFISEMYLIKDIDKAIEKSDVVILALPLTPETQGLINSDIIEKMKIDSIIVNVSRGKIIKEEDLINALEKEKILGVALDVFEEEPLNSESKLWDFENVIITPHNSFVSDRNDERMWNLIINNLAEVNK